MQQVSAAAESPTVIAPRFALGILFCVILLDLLGFGLVLPLLALFGNDILKNLLPANPTSPLAGPILGALMSVFSLMQFFFSPLWGQLADRLGRRPIILWGLSSSSIFYLLLGVALGVSEQNPALGLTLLFVSRIGAGISAATIGTAQAIIADCTSPTERKKGMALLGAAFGLGFTFGPLVGFAALHWWPEGLGIVGYVAATLSLLGFLLGLVLLPETRRAGADFSPRHWLHLGSLLRILHMPTVGVLFGAFFLVNFAFGSFESTLALYNEDLLGVERKYNLLIFSFVGLTLLFSQGFLYRRLAGRWSEITFSIIGLNCMGMGVAGLGGAAVVNHWLGTLPWGGLLGWVLLTLALAILGFAFVTPSLQALISRRSNPHRQGEVLGANLGISSLARIMGPMVGLSLFKLEASHVLPYACSALLLLLLLPLLPRIRLGESAIGYRPSAIGHHPSADSRQQTSDS